MVRNSTKVMWKGNRKFGIRAVPSVSYTHLVLDENYEPVAGAYQYADVVKDGMVVDYIGAIKIVKDMKQKLEAALETELTYAAAAIPPGTDRLDGGAVKNVVEAAGFEITSMLDEPTAANNLLKLQNGAVVDIGGGTTGISIMKDGKVVAVEDEPTGGTHFSLVLAGSYKMPFEEADVYKRDEDVYKRQGMRCLLHEPHESGPE